MLACNRLIVCVLVAFACLSQVQGQNNLCTPAVVAACVQYPCVQVANTAYCICADGNTLGTAAECNALVGVTTLAPGVIPNQCINAICPAGSTCIPTNQNPSLYICLCPNNIIANPSCPVNQLPNNPCVLNNPCLSGSTCVVNTLTLQAVCLCPPNTYGANCALSCRAVCDSTWCLNGGQCVNAYGRPYCNCGLNFRGRRCELYYNRLNYVYLYQNPRW